MKPQYLTFHPFPTPAYCDYFSPWRSMFLSSSPFLSYPWSPRTEQQLQQGILLILIIFLILLRLVIVEVLRYKTSQDVQLQGQVFYVVV